LSERLGQVKFDKLNFPTVCNLNVSVIAKSY